MAEPRAGNDSPAFHCDLVAAALHALADLIDNREVDRQFIEFDPDELRQHAVVLEQRGRLQEDRSAPSTAAAAPPRRRLQDSLSTALRHLGPRSAGELIYASPNGDRWTLVCDGTTKRMMVWHVPNAVSGGQPSETELTAFLANETDAPEYVALRRLLQDR